ALNFAAGLFGDSLVLPYVFSLAGFILTFVVIYFSVNKRAKNRYDITIVGFVGDDDEA
ncbi:MAG: hypothetical protein GX303_04955, partial [Clostridiales bacterium]|nr:hypothetical protein [Clostridiales bacterium]